MDSKLKIIHVRFAADGSVTEIGERPKGTSAQEWFAYLSRNTQNCYQTLTGGRGIFRLGVEQVEGLKNSCQVKEPA
jgi:hypothetical protein